jgi:hypothetical protein
MGLTVPHIKYIIKIFSKYKIRGKIMCLGNQDVYLNEIQLKKILKENKIDLNNIVVEKTRSLEFAKYSESKNFISSVSLFNALGIDKKDYFDIDKFSFDKPKITHDLQKPIKKKYHNKFDFVLDSGTLEHIFDIKSVLFNLVKITKIKGRILHIIPCHNYVNHGFYTFSPTFIYDFYKINGFKIDQMYVAELCSFKQRFYEYNHTQSIDGYYLNRNKRYLIYALVKKIKNKKIKIPDQSFYAKRSIKLKTNDNFIDFVKNQIPFRFHPIFFDIFYRFKSFNFKKKFFDLTNSI